MAAACRASLADSRHARAVLVSGMVRKQDTGRRAAGLGRVLGVVAMACLLGPGCREPAPDKAAATDPPTEAPEPPRPAPRAVPAPVPALTRADIVSAAAQAASEFAVTGKVATDALAGRSFLVRIAFGCAGAATADATRTGLAGWSPTAGGTDIKVQLEPADWSQAAFMTPEASAKWEAVEGFWIPRPWLAAETCPRVATRAAPAGTAASPQSVGLAAVFERGGSRLGRRDGRAYSFTIRGRDDAPAVAPAAFSLVLAGRIAAFADGRSFACTASGPDQRPVCVAAVQLDRVAFEGDGETLTEWQPG